MPLAAKPTATLAALLGLVLAATLGSLALGSVSIGVGEVVGSFVERQDTDAHAIVREARVPRTLAALAVGGALGAAGALIQGMTRNPLADPGILGIEAGAALAVVLAIFLLGISSTLGFVWFAFAGALAAGAAVHLLAGGSRGTPVDLAVAGAAVAALCLAAISAVTVVDTRTLDEFRFWAVGSVAGRDLDALAVTAPFLVAGLVVALAAGRALNALALGEDVARALGERVALVQGAMVAGFVLLAGGAVAVAGPVGFVGLVAPHAARRLLGPDYRWLVPGAVLVGAALVLVADVLGRLVANPREIQVGIVLALVGVPVLIAIVRGRRLASL